jgi:hypothetical protein
LSADLIQQPARSFKRYLLSKDTPEPAFWDFQSQILAVGEDLREHISLQVLEDAIESVDLVRRFGEESTKTWSSEQIDE